MDVVRNESNPTHWMSEEVMILNLTPMSLPPVPTFGSEGSVSSVSEAQQGWVMPEDNSSITTSVAMECASNPSNPFPVAGEGVVLGPTFTPPRPLTSAGN